MVNRDRIAAVVWILLYPFNQGIREGYWSIDMFTRALYENHRTMANDGQYPRRTIHVHLGR